MTSVIAGFHCISLLQNGQAKQQQNSSFYLLFDNAPSSLFSVPHCARWLARIWLMLKKSLMKRIWFVNGRKISKLRRKMPTRHCRVKEKRENWRRIHLDVILSLHFVVAFSLILVVTPYFMMKTRIFRLKPGVPKFWAIQPHMFL